MQRFIIRAEGCGLEFVARTLKSGLAAAAGFCNAVVFTARLENGPAHVLRFMRPPYDRGLALGFNLDTPPRAVVNDIGAFARLAMRRHGCKTWRAYCRRYPGDSMLTIEEDDRRSFNLLGV